jgi:cell wall-associated NlpC family hydrolase
MRWGAAVAALVTSVALAPAPALGLHGGRASHHHGPSAAAVASSKRAVARRLHEVRIAEAAVVQAKQALARLNVTAEVAFEFYDGAKVKLRAARFAVDTAHHVLAGANAEVANGQAAVTKFATAAYESGGLSSIDAYLSPGGPSQLVSRVGAIDAISNSERTTLQRLDAGRIYQAVVSRQAEVVAARAAAAAVVARRAKAAAVAAVNRQNAVLHGMRLQQARLRALLVQARAHATKLERARIAAIIARRRAAARRLAAAHARSAPSPFSGSSGSTAGTVSAATAASALSAAESQIGKPYRWAAAGPSSYDCSGLVMWAYDRVGVHMDHWTGDQWNEGAHVSRADLRPGDLVFFALNTSDPSTIHHVGMYVGNGLMVDAPFTGVDVRYDSVDRPDYIGAVRPYQQ